jgi:hypothetical protein
MIDLPLSVGSRPIRTNRVVSRPLGRLHPVDAHVPLAGDDDPRALMYASQQTAPPKRLKVHALT